MKLQLIGINHKTAPVAVRERLAIPESHLEEAIKRLTAHPGVDEGLILSTCNRVEVVAHSNRGDADLRGFIREYFHLEPLPTNPISTNIKNTTRSAIGSGSPPALIP